MEIRDLFQRHLPTLLALHISSLVQRGNTLVLTLASQRQQGQCPACGYHSFSVHSYYGRTLMDVPCLGHQVTLRLITRRFRCSVANCPKRTFAERFGDFATPYSRLTERLKRMMVGVAVSIGGEPGARLLHHFDIDSSADRLLAMTHALDVPVVECPTALGIDDFAFCRNRSYGTVMVNLDTGRTVDLLPDRQANTVTAWLEAHPTIEVIARDRSREYATGISQGAPQAVQVLDRWHVLKNLREAVEHDLLREQPEIIKLFAANENELAPARRYGKEYLAHQAAVARRQSQHQQVHTLHAQGTHPEDIAKRVKVSLSTVYRIRRQDHPPEPVRLPKQASVLDPYLPYLQQRWAEGCTVAQELFREVQQQGYRGSVGRVRSWLRQRCHLPQTSAYRRPLQSEQQPKHCHGCCFGNRRPLMLARKTRCKRSSRRFPSSHNCAV